jgi:predicted P-loop ATPase
MIEQAKDKKEIGKVRPFIKNKFTEAEQYLTDKYDFRRNILSLEIEIKRKEDVRWEPVNENSLFRELQKTGNGIALNVIVALLRSDFIPDYDPLDRYFTSLRWNHENHIDKLAWYVKAVDEGEWTKHFKKHLVRSVACALDENYFNKQALIIVQELQNSGKSTFIRFLCPPALDEYIAEDVTTDKDSRILLVKNFIINLDELDKLNKKEIAAVKSFISKVQINERLPYDRKNSILKRRASFFGSTNNFEILDDPTGSVRWVCFDIKGIDFNYSKKIDINQVWAEAYHLYKSGFEYELTKEEIRKNEERNKRFQVLSMERELIVKLFEPAEEKDFDNFWTATEVLEKLNGLSNLGHKLNRVQVGKALSILGFPKGQKTENRISGYFLKLKNIDE